MMMALQAGEALGEGASETVTGNQTVTNVHVTIDEKGGASSDSIIVSSAIITGFVGFGTIFKISEIAKLFHYKGWLLDISMILIGIMITLHLTVMLLTYGDIMPVWFYYLTIIMTIIPVVATIIIMIRLVKLHAVVEKSSHDEKATFQTLVDEARNKGNQGPSGPVDSFGKS